MPLDIKLEREKLKTLYEQSVSKGMLKVLLLGESGSGKTFSMSTARKPVHIDSFDPGGAKGLREWITSGDIVADVSYENENPLKPSVYERWAKDFEWRVKNGYFENFATYVLDSTTTWAEAIMNYILAKEGLAGKPPRFTHDYVPQKTFIRNHIRNILNLPCDVFVLGHLRPIEDQVSKETKLRFMTTGQGDVTIPLLFDELWVMDPRSTHRGVEYRLLTKSTGTNLARSRLAAGGKLDTYEKPDIKEMLKKAGMPYEDLK